MSEPFIGEIRIVGFNFAPRGWALCDGQLLAVNQNDALFSLLGTTYGGDGRTTFALPDLRGRVAVHNGNGPGLSAYQLGQKGGEETVALGILHLPSHSHSVSVPSSSNEGNSDDPAGAVPAVIPATDAYGTTSDGTMAPFPSASSGNGQAHPNLQPYLCVHYVIALVGTYPARS